MNIFLLSIDSDIKLVFMWWLEQFGKVFNLMKHIPIFGKTVTLYHVIIAFCIIKILIAIIKYSDSVRSFFDDDDNYIPQHAYHPKHAEDRR